MGAKIQAFDIFQTPLSSHYPLPLKYISSKGTKKTKDSKAKDASIGAEKSILTRKSEKSVW
jgi:hypothetical protein